jgi:hypothetical protein
VQYRGRRKSPTSGDDGPVTRPQSAPADEGAAPAQQTST